MEPLKMSKNECFVEKIMFSNNLVFTNHPKHVKWKIYKTHLGCSRFTTLLYIF